MSFWSHKTYGKSWRQKIREADDPANMLILAMEHAKGASQDTLRKWVKTARTRGVRI